MHVGLLPPIWKHMQFALLFNAPAQGNVLETLDSKVNLGSPCQATIKIPNEGSSIPKLEDNFIT